LCLKVFLKFFYKKFGSVLKSITLAEQTNTKIKMKTFTLSIFKGHDLKQEKKVEVSSIEELRDQKKIFWSESPYKKGTNKNWMGTKRIK
jgi:hypothetical protein